MKPKSKVSISIENDILAEIDKEAERRASSRSHIIEIWLKLASRRRAAQDLEADTLTYYESRTAAQREEDEAWGRASAAAAKALRVDD